MNDLIEIPHEVEHLLKQAKAQDRVENKYETQAYAKEAELDKLLKKKNDAHDAKGRLLCAAQDKGIEMGVFPGLSGGRPTTGQRSFMETATALCGFSREKVRRLMLEHRMPEVAKTKTQQANEARKDAHQAQARKAKLYEEMQQAAEEEDAMEAEVQAELDAKASIHILKARCQSALKGQLKRIGDNPAQLEQLAEFIDSFGDEA